MGDAIQLPLDSGDTIEALFYWCDVPRPVSSNIRRFLLTTSWLIATHQLDLNVFS